MTPYERYMADIRREDSPVTRHVYRWLMGLPDEREGQAPPLEYDWIGLTETTASRRHIRIGLHAQLFAFQGAA